VGKNLLLPPNCSQLEQFWQLLSQNYSFQQVLLKLDPRLGLLNLGGAMLKAPFGTAVVSDVNQLHDLFDKLKSNQQNVVYSIDNQITYIKELDPDTSENAEIIANLSSVIKDNIIRSHDRFQQIAKD
jgi:hypothetical protein